MKEKTLEEIRLEGIRGATLQVLIDYCYNNTININTSDLHEILAVADFFSFIDLLRTCEKLYMKAICAENAIDIVAIADLYCLNELLQYARNFIHADFMNVVQSEAFFQLKAERLIEYLQSDFTLVESEETVFNTIMKWIEYDSDERKQHYASLMETIRMSKITSNVSVG